MLLDMPFKCVHNNKYLNQEPPENRVIFEAIQFNHLNYNIVLKWLDEMVDMDITEKIKPFICLKKCIIAQRNKSLSELTIYDRFIAKPECFIMRNDIPEVKFCYVYTQHYFEHMFEIVEE